jgi:hypothetical protein
MLAYVHHRTLDSLETKFNKHLTSAQDVLNKVLKDAQAVSIKRNLWKEKKQQQREVTKNVLGDVLGDVPLQEKRREEKRKKEHCPSEKNRTDYALDFDTWWKAYPKRTGSKKAAFDQWQKLNGTRPPLATLLDAISTQIDWRKHANGAFRPEWKDPERWLKGRMWEMETPYGEGGDNAPHEETPVNPIVTRYISEEDVLSIQKKRDEEEIRAFRNRWKPPHNPRLA